MAGEPQSSYLVEDGAGGLGLPVADVEGDEWNVRLPAIGVSRPDALAYCAWRSARDGLCYRLPTEEEWEKAARGVDGRWFPWGWRFDPSQCNMRLSRKERPSPVAVDEFPADVSVYEVRGLGGNIRDWTSSDHMQGPGPGRKRVSCIYRGGAWLHAAPFSRAASRHWGESTYISDYLGFRLARSLR